MAQVYDDEGFRGDPTPLKLREEDGGNSEPLPLAPGALTPMQEASLTSVMGNMAEAKAALLSVFDGQNVCRCRRPIRAALSALEPGLTRVQQMLGLRRA